MKILKPELEVINEKFKDDPMKKQQETMSLYTKSGANPMSGCLPALLQMPLFFALFTFFPVAFSLRQKSFLWADDLSSYDSILELGFYIPLYGDHVSLFPILASISSSSFSSLLIQSSRDSPTSNFPPGNSHNPGILPFKSLLHIRYLSSSLKSAPVTLIIIR